MRGETGLFPMNYTSPEKPVDDMTVSGAGNDQPYMPSPHLSSRSSGSTIEEEIENALSQFQATETTTSTIPTTNHTHVDETQPEKSGNQRIEQWDVQQVADWLKSVGLESVSTNFIGNYQPQKKNLVSRHKKTKLHKIDQEITGDILLDLNIEALKELGINTFGKRYKIMQAITLLKKDAQPKVIDQQEQQEEQVNKKISHK